MRKIANTEDNNKYYQMVNEFIDEYIHQWKISPSKLKNYFSNTERVNSFLKRYQIDDVEGIKRVVKDVLEDRESMEKDGILKFESFINEDLGNISIPKSSISHEKVLADLYHTSVGHVDIIDENDHKYKINDFGKEVDVIIYSEEDVNEFKNSSLPLMVQQLKDKTIDLFKVDLGLKSGKEIKCNLMLNVSDLVNDDTLEKYLTEKLNKEKIVEMITHFINDYPILREKKEYRYKTGYKGYLIWELEERGNSIKKM